ncbi:MAG TPA: hypothetical protein DEF06_07680 [Clostridiales bacterium]|nr:hypothetical protein [Clostridiales bacterium]
MPHDNEAALAESLCGFKQEQILSKPLPPPTIRMASICHAVFKVSIDIKCISAIHFKIII